ncbi:MAG: dihydrolipoamide acetyltransferase family protein [Actinomycetes bacterium]
MPDVIMPRLSDTMEEGVLGQWLKHEGDPVHKGDVLAEIETDKATMELEAFDEGVLERLLVEEGATVPIGQAIAVIGDGTGQAAPVAALAAPTPIPAGTPTPVPAAVLAPVSAPAEGATIVTSPLARRTARENGVDLATIQGTGPGGRIVRADVEAAVTVGTTRSAVSPAPAPSPAAATSAAGRSSGPNVPAQQGEDERIPLTAIRRITAARLTESAAVPHFSLTTVVDADRLLAFRTEVNAGHGGRGVKVSVTDLLVRAVAVTLLVHPQVNSSWVGDAVLRHHRINVGVAVAIDDGLIVPVVHDADRKNLGEISTETRRLAERARAGRLTLDEVTGGTFTISNLGMYGVDHFTAVINPPEAAILAVGSANLAPVVRDGQVQVRTAIKLTMTSDHRVLDGAVAAQFLRDLKSILEEPLRIVV